MSQFDDVTLLLSALLPALAEDGFQPIQPGVLRICHQNASLQICIPIRWSLTVHPGVAQAAKFHHFYVRFAVDEIQRVLVRLRLQGGHPDHRR